METTDKPLDNVWERIFWDFSQGIRPTGEDKYVVDLAVKMLYEGRKVWLLSAKLGYGHSKKFFDKLLRELFAHHKDQMKDHVKYDKAKLTIEFI